MPVLRRSRHCLRGSTRIRPGRPGSDGRPDPEDLDALPTTLCLTATRRRKSTSTSTSTLPPSVEVDGSEAVRGRLPPPSTSTRVTVAIWRFAERSTCNVEDGVDDYVPLRCRQGSTFRDKSRSRSRTGAHSTRSVSELIPFVYHHYRRAFSNSTPRAHPTARSSLSSVKRNESHGAMFRQSGDIPSHGSTETYSSHCVTIAASTRLAICSWSSLLLWVYQHTASDPLLLKMLQ